MKAKYGLAIAATFIWIGFLGAISFMEAWLKFRAPGVSLSVGLGIGKLVFGALNKVEIALMILILLNIFFAKGNLFRGGYLFFFIPLVIVLLQTFWALPALDKLANLVINNQPLPSSSVHIYYVAMEVAKLICLFVFGAGLLKKNAAQAALREKK